MARFTLMPYTVRARTLRNKDEYLPLDRLPQENREDQSGGNRPNHTNILNVLNAYLQQFQDEYVEYQESKVLRLRQLEQSGNEIVGIVLRGPGGLRSELYDLDADEIAFIREIIHAEMFPYYFLIHVPAGATRGYALIQRFYNFGIKSAMFNNFRRFLRSNCENVIFEMNPVAESALLAELIDNGKLIDISVIKLQIPSDKTTQFRLGGAEERAGRLTVSIQARAEGFQWRPRLRRYINNELGLNELVEFPDFVPDNIKVTFEMGGRQYTVDLANPTDIRPRYDVTNDVLYGDDQFPTFDSINVVAHQHLTRLLQAGQT